MNTVRCMDCRNYDVIRSGKTKTPTHGWCSVKSIYPMKEEVGGPTFPPGVRRRESAEMPAKPEIVVGDGVVIGCSQVSVK
jgi:hypothetical protein